MRYRKHQKVFCIRDESWCKPPLKQGEVYTIKQKYKCKCGSSQLILEEIDIKINMICQCGHSEYRYQSYYEWRFRPYMPS